MQTIPLQLSQANQRGLHSVRYILDLAIFCVGQDISCLPLSTGWGVKVYETKCDSVKDYMRIINEVFAYAEFREMRGDGETDALVLARTLKRWAAEDHYTDLIEDVIKYNLRGKYDL